MARRERNTDQTTDSTSETVPTEVQEDTVSTITEAVEETVDSTTASAPEATATSTEAKAEIDLSGFKAAVEAAVAEHDTSTGTVPEGLATAVTAEYRALDGLAAKNAAKKFVNDSMRDSMNEMNIQKARAYMVLSDGLTAGAGGTKAERPPADPTEAFVQRLGALQLAAEIVGANVPEGVDSSYTAKLDELLASSRDGAKTYGEWLNREPVAEGADDLPEPEVSAFVKAAVKLSQGKAVKTGSGRASTPFTGERRDIGKHIAEAFADKESGTFMTVAEIRKFESSEYNAESPASAGAISARLFPTSGKCTVEGITPGTNDKANRGADKD
jgi:hypothetical protein